MNESLKKHHRLILILIIFFSGFFIRTYFILHYPVVYHWDGVNRLIYPEYIFLQQWLLIPQIFIFSFYHAGIPVVAIRWVCALVGALLPVTGFLLAERIFSWRAGLFAGLFLASNSYLVTFTIVPYQEGFFLSFLLAGLYCIVTERPRWISFVLLYLALLTRIEGWLIIPILAFLMTNHSQSSGKIIYMLKNMVLLIVPVILLWVLKSRIPTFYIPDLEKYIITPDFLKHNLPSAGVIREHFANLFLPDKLLYNTMTAWVFYPFMLSLVIALISLRNEWFYVRVSLICFILLNFLIQLPIVAAQVSSPRQIVLIITAIGCLFAGSGLDLPLKLIWRYRTKITAVIFVILIIVYAGLGVRASLIRANNEMVKYTQLKEFYCPWLIAGEINKLDPQFKYQAFYFNPKLNGQVEKEVRQLRYIYAPKRKIYWLVSFEEIYTKIDANISSIIVTPAEIKESLLPADFNLHSKLKCGVSIYKN